jgi:anaerobic dimethyl sulfoxide reductase subunit A
MEGNKNGSTEQIIKTATAHHCGGCCVWKVHVKDGKITRMEPDDDQENPQLRGCLRGHAMVQRLYAPDRLNYPMKRVGPRGSGKFERISWDEALHTIVSELRSIKEKYGNASIICGGGTGDVTMIQGYGFHIERLLNMFGGYTGTWGWPSWEAATFASQVNYGTYHVMNSRDDQLNSKLIILWGVSPTDTIHSTNTMWYFKKAKEAGTKIISIDPRYTNTAAVLADQWIPINPATDTAMLMAMAFMMIKEDLQDQEFLDRYTIGFDRFRDYVFGKEDGVAKTPEWAEERTGVDANVIRQLARDYATMKPAALISGISPGRTAFGEQFHRATATLAAMTGNIGIHGGEAAGRSLGDQAPFHAYPFRMGPWMKIGENPVDKESPIRHFYLKNYTLRDHRSYSRVHLNKVADAFLKGKAGGYHADYKAFVVVNINPVNQFPSTIKWHKALQNLEFMLVMEQFMTATARYADILLPTAEIFEKNDLIVGGATPFYGFIKKIVEPFGERKSQLDICTLLAERLGIEGYNDKTDEEWIKQIVTGGGQKIASQTYGDIRQEDELTSAGDVPDWEEFKKNAIYRIPLKEPYVAFKKQIEDPENNPFPTPSGKIEIYSQLLADMEDPFFPPIPKYFEPWEGRKDPLVTKYPLQMITPRFRRRTHTQFDTLPWLREVQENNMEINAKDADERGIRNGDMTKIFNDRGEIRIRATVTERIMPGVVGVPQGGWFQPDENMVDRGGCPNTLNSERYSPCGSFTWNSALVQVEKVEENAK